MNTANIEEMGQKLEKELLDALKMNDKAVIQKNPWLNAAYEEYCNQEKEEELANEMEEKMKELFDTTEDGSEEPFTVQSLQGDNIAVHLHNFDHAMTMKLCSTIFAASAAKMEELDRKRQELKAENRVAVEDLVEMCAAEDQKRSLWDDEEKANEANDGEKEEVGGTCAIC